MSSDPNSGASESVASGEMKEPIAHAGNAPAASPGTASHQPVGEAGGNEVADSGAEGDAAEEARRQRIKIGTQRPGVVAPRVEPRTKVAFRTPPIEPVVSAKAPMAASPAPASVIEQQPRRDEPLDLPPAAPPIKFKDQPRKPRFELPSDTKGKVEKPNLRGACRRSWKPSCNRRWAKSRWMKSSPKKPARRPAKSWKPKPASRGACSRIFRDDVFVDLGGRNQGILTLHTLAKEPEIGANWM